MIESRLSAILDAQDILLGFTADSVADALPRLLGPVLQRSGVSHHDSSAILAAIADRERSGSTISPPVALPHARHERAPSILAALAINGSGTLREPQGVKAIVAFVSPIAAAAEHLRFLSGVARLFRSPEALEQLTAARTPDDVIALLRKHGA